MSTFTDPSKVHKKQKKFAKKWAAPDPIIAIGGQQYEKQIGRTGQYRDWYDIAKHPVPVAEEEYKRGGIYKGLKSISPDVKLPPVPPAAPTTVLGSQHAKSFADRLKRKRRRYRTVMSGGGGDLNLSQSGLLGV